jgi:drug/metabolite transporter (DMT)-like permease
MSDRPSREWLGLALGAAGVMIFSLTLPMTRLAVAELPAEVVGLGRTIPAAAVAVLYLLVTRARWPVAREWMPLAVAASGVVFGFPLFSALAMREVDASHGGVVLALLPLLTAAAGAILGGERPSFSFWLYAIAGAVTVVVFALWRSKGGIEIGDVYLLVAATLAAIGYAVGAVTSRSMPGAHVISWALAVSIPVLIPVGV